MNKFQKSRANSIRIVALGGGTGLSMLLRGLKHHVASRPEELARPDKFPISDLVAVVTVTDDGGSSGRLRREYSILPPGDIRNCLVGLSEDEALLGRLFQYRFPVGRALAGHSFGNLFLTALTNVTGDFPEAVRFSGQVLAIRGRIYPSTTANVTLEALLDGGRRVRGETKISRSPRRIRRISLVPTTARPLPEVLEAIHEADMILLGPGSLYTSLIPNLLVRGVADAIRKSRAKCVYISNLMTQPGETDGYSLTDHVRAIYDHSREQLFDSVVINRTSISPAILRRYRREGAVQVQANPGALRRMGITVISDELLQKGQVVRHDHMQLARLILAKCDLV